MAKPKNKTCLRVGDKLYDKYLDEFTVETLEVLSNKVIYITVRSGENWLYECVVYNSNSTGSAVFINNYKEEKTFFFGKNEAQKEYKRMNNQHAEQALGYYMHEIIKIIRK